MDITDYFQKGGEDTLVTSPPKTREKSIITSRTTIQHEIDEIFDEMKSTEITITFKPVLHNTWGEEMLGEIVEKTIRKILKKAPISSRIILIGEHSKTGLFHYHGILQGIPNDYICRLRKRLSQEIGRVEIKQISYFESYKKYLFKSYTGENYLPEEWKVSSYIKINI